MLAAELAADGGVRAKVVDVARSWCGTPFHDVAGVKHVGVDCAHLLERVYSEAGAMPPLDIEPYPPAWHLHRSEELFLGYVEQRGRRIDAADVGPGDMAVFKMGRTFSHGAIVVDWPLIIHAWKQAGCVLEARADEFGLADRETRFYTLW